MAFFKETTRSLRAYLILAGILGTAGQVAGALSAEAYPISRLLSFVGIAIALAYAWLGFAFKSLITSAPRRIEQVLIAGAGYSIALAAIAAIVAIALRSSEEAGGALVRGALGLVITLYVLKNVRRLAREAQAPTSASSSSSAA